MRYEIRSYLNHKVRPRPKKMRAPVANRNALVYDSTARSFRNGAQIRKR